MPAAARVGDNTQHNSPHCHAPIHPAAPTPTPLAHPPVPLAILPPGSPNVMIESKPAARATDQTKPCMLPSCVPGGPGIISKGSMTVMINGLPAARANDIVAFASCVAPIPSPMGKIMPPCATKTQIGG
jgi:uncharacterized Zn-binding protein involved in type VI secretion